MSEISNNNNTNPMMIDESLDPPDLSSSIDHSNSNLGLMSSSVVLPSTGSLPSYSSPSLILQATIPLLISLTLLLFAKRFYRLTTSISVALSFSFFLWVMFVNLQSGPTIAGWSGEVAALTLWSAMVGAGLLGALLGYQARWWGAHVTGRLCLGANAGISLAFSILLVSDGLTIHHQAGQWSLVALLGILSATVVLMDQSIGPLIAIILQAVFLLQISIDLFSNRGLVGLAIGLRFLLDHNPSHASSVTSYHALFSSKVLIGVSYIMGLACFAFQYILYRSVPFGPIVPSTDVESTVIVGVSAEPDQKQETGGQPAHSTNSYNPARTHGSLPSNSTQTVIDDSSPSYDSQSGAQHTLPSNSTLGTTPHDPVDGRGMVMTSVPNVINPQHFGGAPAVAPPPPVAAAGSQAQSLTSSYSRYRRTPDAGGVGVVIGTDHPPSSNSRRAPIHYDNLHRPGLTSYQAFRRVDTVDELTETSNSIIVDGPTEAQVNPTPLLTNYDGSGGVSGGDDYHHQRGNSVSEEYLQAMMRLAAGEGEKDEDREPVAVVRQSMGTSSEQHPTDDEQQKALSRRTSTKSGSRPSDLPHSLENPTKPQTEETQFESKRDDDDDHHHHQQNKTDSSSDLSKFPSTTFDFDKLFKPMANKNSFSSLSRHSFTSSKPGEDSQGGVVVVTNNNTIYDDKRSSDHSLANSQQAYQSSIVERKSQSIGRISHHSSVSSSNSSNSDRQTTQNRLRSRNRLIKRPNLFNSSSNQITRNSNSMSVSESAGAMSIAEDENEGEESFRRKNEVISSEQNQTSPRALPRLPLIEPNKRHSSSQQQRLCFNLPTITNTVTLPSTNESSKIFKPQIEIETQTRNFGRRSLKSNDSSHSSVVDSFMRNSLPIVSNHHTVGIKNNSSEMRKEKGREENKEEKGEEDREMSNFDNQDQNSLNSSSSKMTSIPHTPTLGNMLLRVTDNNNQRQQRDSMMTTRGYQIEDERDIRNQEEIESQDDHESSMDSRRSIERSLEEEEGEEEEEEEDNDDEEEEEKRRSDEESIDEFNHSFYYSNENHENWIDRNYDEVGSRSPSLHSIPIPLNNIYEVPNQNNQSFIGQPLNNIPWPVAASSSSSSSLSGNEKRKTIIQNNSSIGPSYNSSSSSNNNNNSNNNNSNYREQEQNAIGNNEEGLRNQNEINQRFFYDNYSQSEISLTQSESSLNHNNNNNNLSFNQESSSNQIHNNSSNVFCSASSHIDYELDD